MHLPEPHTKKHRLKRLSKALVLAISAGAYVGSSNAVLAQEPSQTQSAELNIPDGTLNDVLKRIARQFNVNIIATTSLIDGITVSGLRGQYKVDNAIQTVLNETDLVVSRDESGAYLIGPQTTLDSKTRQIQPDKPKDIEVIDVFGTRYRPEKVSDTVSRTSIDLKELPNSVTVVTADSISDQNALTTEEVLG
ncbi:MAG: STN domain-containing protein, partial [Pseudomonadota bacterium]